MASDGDLVGTPGRYLRDHRLRLALWIALAEGLVAAGIWRWAAYLIVFGFLLVIVAVLILVGRRKVKRVKAPERTIASSKETLAVLKNIG